MGIGVLPVGLAFLLLFGLAFGELGPSPTAYGPHAKHVGRHLQATSAHDLTGLFAPCLGQKQTAAGGLRSLSLPPPKWQPAEHGVSLSWVVAVAGWRN
jgi:hypothetical protein